MEDNIDYDAITSSKRSEIKLAFDTQNRLIDKATEDLYKYDVYGRFKESNSASDASDVLSDTIAVQDEMLRGLKNRLDNIQTIYDYSADAYRNQEHTNIVMEKQKKVMNKRYNQIHDSIMENQKQHMIYQHQYFKNKAQIKILYTFLFLLLTMTIFTFLNHSFSVYFTDNIYVACMGLSLSFFFIYTCLQLYDIFIRSDFIYDEYEGPTSSLSHLDATTQEIDKSNQKAICEN